MHQIIANPQSSKTTAILGIESSRLEEQMTFLLAPVNLLLGSKAATPDSLDEDDPNFPFTSSAAMEQPVLAAKPTTLEHNIWRDRKTMTPVSLHPPFLHCSTTRTSALWRMKNVVTALSVFGLSLKESGHASTGLFWEHCSAARALLPKSEYHSALREKPYTKLPRKLLFTMWKQHCAQVAPGLCPRYCESSTVPWCEFRVPAASSVPGSCSRQPWLRPFYIKANYQT